MTPSSEHSPPGERAAAMVAPQRGEAPPGQLMSESVSSGFKVLFSLLISTAYAGGGEYTVPDKPIECDALIPADLEARTGWKVVRAEDRHFIAEKVYQGRAQWQRRMTLLCRDMSSGKVTSEFMVYQWWWRAK